MLGREKRGAAAPNRKEFRKKELRREKFRREESERAALERKALGRKALGRKVLEREALEREQSGTEQPNREGFWREALGRDVFEHGSGVVCWVLLLCRVLLRGWLLLALGVLPVPIRMGWETPVLVAAASVALVWAVLSSAGKWVRFRRS